jgi:hypothetical protein
LLLLAACSDDTQQQGFYGPPGQYGGFYCQADTDCPASEECTRTSECLPAADVRSDVINWTVNAMPANATTCGTLTGFSLTFADHGIGATTFEPVPCAEGKFSIDKVDAAYDSVYLQDSAGAGTTWQGLIDQATGIANIDITF